MLQTVLISMLILSTLSEAFRDVGNAIDTIPDMGLSKQSGFNRQLLNKSSVITNSYFEKNTVVTPGDLFEINTNVLKQQHIHVVYLHWVLA